MFANTWLVFWVSLDRALPSTMSWQVFRKVLCLRRPALHFSESPAIFCFFNFLMIPWQVPIWYHRIYNKRETVGIFLQCNTLGGRDFPDSWVPWAPYSDKALPRGLYPALETSRNVRGAFTLQQRPIGMLLVTLIKTVYMLLELSNTSSWCEEPT